MPCAAERLPASVRGAAAVWASLAASAFHFPLKASVKCNTKNQDGSHHLFDSGRSHRPFHRENRSMVHPATQTDTNARPYHRTPTQKRPALPCGGGRPPKRFCSPPTNCPSSIGGGGTAILIAEGTKVDFSGPTTVEPPQKLRPFPAPGNGTGPAGRSTLGSRPRQKWELRPFLPQNGTKRPERPERPGYATGGFCGGMFWTAKSRAFRAPFLF